MDTRLIFVLLAVVGLLLLAMFVRRMMNRGGLDERLQIYAALPDSRRPEGRRARSGLVRARLRLNTTLGALTSEELALKLMSANWPVSPTEYTLLRLVFILLAMALGWLLAQNPLVGVGAAIFAYLTPSFILQRAVNRRQNAFAKQLVDVLVLITGAVRSGFSLLQALEVVVRELAPPTTEEFRRVLQEVSLGRPISAALENMGLRMENRDLDLLVTAIKIQYTVGGNLTTMLEAVTETIRERVRLYSEIRALTSQQRLAAWVISMLPLIVMAVLFVINPEYMGQLFNRRYIYVPTAAAVSMLLGFMIIQRLAKMNV